MSLDDMPRADNRTGIPSYVIKVRRIIARVTPGPFMVRLVVIAAVCGGYALALPARTLASPAVSVVVLVAVMPALLPRGPWPAIAIVGMVVGWLLNVGAEANMWRVCALAAVIYIVHAGSALAAVLPYDAVVSPGLFRPWLVRAGVVTLLTVGLALFTAVATSVLGAGHHLVAAALGGIVVMLTTAMYLSYLGGRR